MPCLAPLLSITSSGLCALQQVSAPSFQPGWYSSMWVHHLSWCVFPSVGTQVASTSWTSFLSQWETTLRGCSPLGGGSRCHGQKPLGGAGGASCCGAGEPSWSKQTPESARTVPSVRLSDRQPSLLCLPTRRTGCEPSGLLFSYSWQVWSPGSGVSLAT